VGPDSGPTASCGGLHARPAGSSVEVLFLCGGGQCACRLRLLRVIIRSNDQASLHNSSRSQFQLNEIGIYYLHVELRRLGAEKARERFR
jgi:hypothetical protein